MQILHWTIESEKRLHVYSFCSCSENVDDIFPIVTRFLHDSYFLHVLQVRQKTRHIQNRILFRWKKRMDERIFCSWLQGSYSLDHWYLRASFYSPCLAVFYDPANKHLASFVFFILTIFKRWSINVFVLADGKVQKLVRELDPYFAEDVVVNAIKSLEI